MPECFAHGIEALGARQVKSSIPPKTNLSNSSNKSYKAAAKARKKSEDGQPSKNQKWNKYKIWYWYLRPRNTTVQKFVVVVFVAPSHTQARS